MLNFAIKLLFQTIKSLTLTCQPSPNTIKMGPKCFYNLNKMSKSLINSLLQIGNLEMNPGPSPQENKNVINIVTYNCNGLGDLKKLKRFMDKVGKITSKGGIVMLQETHLTNNKHIAQNFKGIVD